MTTRTSAPRIDQEPGQNARLVRRDAPVTPSRTRRPGEAGRRYSSSPGLLGSLVVDLALGDLLERDRQRLVASGRRLDERRDELGASLAELVVVRVDLSRTLRREDHQRVLGVDLASRSSIFGSIMRSPRMAGARSEERPLRDASMIAATCVRSALHVVVHDHVVEPVPLRQLPVGLRQAPAILLLVLGPAGAEPALELVDGGRREEDQDRVRDRLPDLLGALDVDLEQDVLARVERLLDDRPRCPGPVSDERRPLEELALGGPSRRTWPRETKK